MSSPTTDNAAVDVRVSPKLLPRLWWLLAVLPVACELFLGLHHLKLSWDDAAITASFSRTWAETGRIALTPVSQTVEGFSSVLWFLLLSIPYYFTHNPNAGLIWMKILSAAFLLLSLRLVYLIALRQFAGRNVAFAPVLLLAYCYTQTQEMENGMEMNLAMFLLLLLFYVLSGDKHKRRTLYASTLCFLLLLTRFEMPFMLALLFCGFLYARYRHRPGAATFRELSKILVATALSFAIIELWRHHVFNEWMPNTIYAKRFAPYKDWSTLAKFLATRRSAILEPFVVLPLPLGLATLGLIYGCFFRKSRRPNFGEIHPAIWTLASGCFLFGAMLGRNWGIPGRMVAAMLPFLILAIAEVFASLISNKHLTEALTLLLISQGFVWLVQEIQYPYEIVSLAHFEPFGTGADAIREALKQDHIVVLISDVGASSLCCERLDIVDSGLLTNRTLARTGWNGFPSYFRKVDPDLIQLHSTWAALTHLYENRLLDNYSIVTSHGVRFFLRNDLFNKLVYEHAGPVLPVGIVPGCRAQYSWNSREDAQFSLSKRTCLVLDGPGTDTSTPIQGQAPSR